MQNKHRLAIITSHPIQYNAPLFKILTDRGNIDIKVFYTWGKASTERKLDPGFGKQIKWDIPLLQGYEYEFLKNVSNNPGSDHFNGINNPDIIKKINDWAPDTLFVYGWSFKSHLKILKHFHNKLPILFRGDSTLLNDSQRISLKKIVRHYFLKWVYKHIDAALFVGIQNRKYFVACGVPERKLFFAPHAVDNNFFSGADEMYKKNAKEWRNKLGIKEADTVFLFAGKYQKEKNPLLLLNAFINIKQANAHLIFVGNGVLEPKLRKEAGKYRNIHFIDFQNQSKMPVVYRLANIFVLPSQSETWGLAVNEAMACSCALLVSDKCGCYSDLVIEGKNGYIFKSDNVQDLFFKIDLLVQHTSKITEMGKTSLQIVKGWNYDKVCNTIERVCLKKNKNF